MIPRVGAMGNSEQPAIAQTIYHYRIVESSAVPDFRGTVREGQNASFDTP